MHDLSLSLGIAIALVLLYEFVNGFHDTANAVATVIYTQSLRPIYAVILAAIGNLLGAVSSGGAVALSILGLLPANLLDNGDRPLHLMMVLALLIAALIWNFGTWYLGLPISSTHGLIGAIVGISLVGTGDHNWLESNTWHSLQEILISLLISPLIGFIGAAFLLLCVMALQFNQFNQFNQVSRGFALSPQINAVQENSENCEHSSVPPLWIRILLITTCSGVSFAHGSNDGQKGIGLMMLILVLALPDRFPFITDTHRLMAEAIPLGVKIAIATVLGLGTLFGWQRVATTVGEKIGKEPMTYAQGATAQFITMITIAIASYAGMPVSTTHVLSSSIAGTMVANRTALQGNTIRNLLLAWVLTLPCCILLGYGVGQAFIALYEYTKV
jgi:phosphate/sulfate permease